MARRFRRWQLWAGLAVLGVMWVGQREAWASLSVGSITIRGGVIQDPGDPPFTYQFEVFVHDAILTQGDFIAINGLVGVTPTMKVTLGTRAVTLPRSPSTDPGYFNSPTDFEAWTTSISFATGGSTAPYRSNVKWTLASASQPIGSLSDPDYFVGEFTVETTQSFPEGQPPISPGSIITYGYTINGEALQTTAMHTGSFPLELGPLSAVPEPSTALFVLWTAGGVLPFLWLRQRRLRSQRAA